MVDNTSLKKGPWTAEEDEKLLAYIQQNSHGSWRSLPSKAGLQRCGKSCRLRWTNYLRPDIKRGKFSLQEEQTIIQLHALLGNRWATIASHLPKRTDNEIKNYWNTHLKKRLTKMGIDPVTHKPKTLLLNCDQSKEIAKISHMAQWESARLQAEARLVRESSRLVVSKPYINSHLMPPPPPPPPCLDILKVWEWTNTPATDGLFQVSSSFIEPPACRGIMENSDHPMPHNAEYFPSFAVDGYTDLSAGTSNNALGVGACWGVLEENKQLDNCWSNMGSPMF